MKTINKLSGLILGGIGVLFLMSTLIGFSGHPNKIIFVLMDFWSKYIGIAQEFTPVYSIASSLLIGLTLLVFAIYLF